MNIYYLLLLLMTLIASSANFSLKKSTINGTIVSIITNKFLYLGGFLYVLSSLLNFWLLQKLPYSVVVPLGSFCYIWIMIIARIFLNEKINVYKIIGVSLIITGVVFIVL